MLQLRLIHPQTSEKLRNLYERKTYFSAGDAIVEKIT